MAWGHDKGIATKTLSNYPNAIAFSGHSHYSLTDERSIWQGAFTSIGQSSLYIDDDGIEDGKMNGFKVMFDCGNEIIPEEEVERIGKWVEKGGVFVAYPFTGCNTQLKADAWPMAKLTGAKIKAGEKIVRPGKVPKVAFPEGSKFFPSFAGQTMYGAKRRIYQLDFALEAVSDDAKPILFWDDGRIAATARRVGKGLGVHLGSMFWRGSEDVKGMWNPSDEVERTFLRDLLAAVGHSPALVETDDRLVLAQPYRSHDGLNLVAVLCNFNEEGDGFNTEAQRHRVTEVKLRTGSKPRRIVGYAGEGILFTARSSGTRSRSRRVISRNTILASGKTRHRILRKGGMFPIL